MPEDYQVEVKRNTYKAVALAAYERGFLALEMEEYSVALREFSSASGAGFVPAMFELSELYRKGWGIKQDRTEAMRWLNWAAEEGNAEAHYRLGLINFDNENREYFLRFATEQGHIEASWLMKQKLPF